MLKEADERWRYHYRTEFMMNGSKKKIKSKGKEYYRHNKYFKKNKIYFVSCVKHLGIVIKHLIFLFSFSLGSSCLISQ
jgi:hypothetical protein